MSNERRMPFLLVASFVALAACAGEPGTGPASPAPPTAPPPPPPPPSPSTGSVRATTTTTGDDLDFSAYVVSLGETRKRIELEGSTTFDQLAAGDYTLRLSDVAHNCSVAGGNSQQVSVTGGGTAVATFDVSCAALPPAAVDVSGMWMGTYREVDPQTGQENGQSGPLTYQLAQDGDDITASVTYLSVTYSGTGRVSGSTLTLFFLGEDTETGPGKVTAVLEVNGDAMAGSEREQMDDWAANTELARQ